MRHGARARSRRPSNAVMHTPAASQHPVGPWRIEHTPLRHPSQRAVAQTRLASQLDAFKTSSGDLGCSWPRSTCQAQPQLPPLHPQACHVAECTRLTRWRDSHTQAAFSRLVVQGALLAQSPCSAPCQESTHPSSALTPWTVARRRVLSYLPGARPLPSALTRAHQRP